MAKELRHEKSIQDLRQEIAHSRDRLAQDLTGLRYELDFPLKFRKSFQRNAGLWVSAAVLTGVVFTARALPRRKVVHTAKIKAGRPGKSEEPAKGLLEAGIVVGALKLLVPILRPILVRMVTQKLGSYASGMGRTRKW